MGRVEYEWDGRDDAGAVVADGPYRVRVRLSDDRRTIVIPVDVSVDTQPPRVTDVRSRRRASRSARRSRSASATKSSARRSLVVDGEVVERGPGRPGAARAGSSGRRSAPGSYRVAVAFEDLAGNVSEPAGATRVTVTGS